MHTEDGRLVERVPWAKDGRATYVENSRENSSDNSRDNSRIPQTLLAVVQPEAYCSNQSYGSHNCHTQHNQVCLYLREIEPLDGLLSFDNSDVATMIVIIVMLQQDF
jgi:hypothetical protein